MSLIILDTKMPIGDEVLVIRSDGTCTKRDAAEVAFFGRAKKRRPTMIQTLKPHGRLIDASEKVTIHYDEHIKTEMTIDELLLCGWIDANAPTIVPAENGNDEHGETTKNVRELPDGCLELSGSIRISVRKG